MSDRLADPDRRTGELNFRELLRWAWRQLTSMRTALILLLLLALAAVPGSLIPQQGVDALKTSQWQEAHPDLTPVYDRLGLFDVYGTPWFAAIYVLLMVSLVGCIIPRTLVYLRAIRSAPPRAPRNLGRLPDHASYRTDEDVEVVLERARQVLRRRRYRVRPDDGDASVSSERGYLREVGNLVFHLSVIIVLVGFAYGSLFGYKGGVILPVGTEFSNTLTQYDDFVPGDLFSDDDMEPFCFTVDDFDVEWLTSGPRAGMSRGFNADTRYQADCTGADASDEQQYDLRVNHPLAIGKTEVFLIGHGYAPVITVRDGEGNVAWNAPTIFLPQDQTLFSFGVVKAGGARPSQIGLEGVLFPTFVLDSNGDPQNLMGQLNNPLLSMSVYSGDLGLSDGSPQSVYILEKDGLEKLKNDDGSDFRLDMQVGDTVELPNGLGSVTFDGIQEWNRLQISRTPGKLVALTGVVLALIGLLGSLFIRPRRLWVRARVVDGETLVEVAALDRSGGGDVTPEIETVVAALRGDPPAEEKS